MLIRVKNINEMCSGPALTPLWHNIAQHSTTYYNTPLDITHTFSHTDNTLPFDRTSPEIHLSIRYSLH